MVDVEGLGVEVAVDGEGAKAAEVSAGDGGGSEDGFGGLEAGALDVVVVGEDVAGIDDGEAPVGWGGGQVRVGREVGRCRGCRWWRRC